MSELELDRIKSMTYKGKKRFECVEWMAEYCRTDSSVVKRIRITDRSRLEWSVAVNYCPEFAAARRPIKNFCLTVYDIQAFTNLTT
jgi:hypothetical protein